MLFYKKENLATKFSMPSIFGLDRRDLKDYNENERNFYILILKTISKDEIKD